MVEHLSDIRKSLDKIVRHFLQKNNAIIYSSGINIHYYHVIH